MSELGTLRWGDYQTFPIAVGETVPLTTIGAQTKQLVSAAWHVPMSWNVILVAFPQFDASENATFTVNWNFVIGAGQGSIGTIPLFTMTLAKVAGTYPLQQQQQLIPAENLQITCSVFSPGPTTTRAEQLTVGAFVAPNNAEPFAERDAMADLIESMRELRRIIAPHAPEPEGPSERMRWMPMGFQDDPLSYQRRRR